MSRTAATLLLAALAALGCRLAEAGEAGVALPAPAADLPKAAGPAQTAVVAGGCFWGVEGVFEHVKGVRRVTSGYAGGAQADADYDRVSNGTTGHAESVSIEYDPAEVSYGELLRIFFSIAHDPTQKDRQGPDVGTQYRSAIFPADAQQKDVAARYVAQLDAAKVLDRPIATTIEPQRAFYPAEPYHQDFIARNPRYPYVVVHDLPKIRNLERAFPSEYRADVIAAPAPTER
jgi:peptide-methionine (S)-S-oxide reductase